MRPVLRTIIDKNGGKEVIFTPTPTMIIYSVSLSRNRNETQERVCELAGIDPSCPRRWKEKYGTHFTEWLEESMEYEVADEALILDRFGMQQALQPGNFQYFREMARSRGVIKDEVKTQNITINTDFKQVLVAAGGDLAEARRKLLESTRGVVVEGGSGVVSAPQQRLSGSVEGEGAGTRDVQGEPLALADALGANRGRTKRGSSIPTIPE